MRGFTLVETMIVVSITVILSSILIAYNRSTESQLALVTDQAKVVGVLSRAKSLALERYKGQGSISLLVCSFGVAVIPAERRYVLFGDEDADGDVTDGTCIGNGEYNDGEIIESFTLSRNVLFKNPLSGFSIFFKAPYLETVFNPPLSGGLTITLGIQNREAEAMIEIGEGGYVTAL